MTKKQILDIVNELREELDERYNKYLPEYGVQRTIGYDDALNDIVFSIEKEK